MSGNVNPKGCRAYMFLHSAAVRRRHNARCRAPALITAALIVRVSVRGGVRPLHTKLHTLSRFWVSHGIIKQHGERADW